MRYAFPCEVVTKLLQICASLLVVKECHGSKAEVATRSSAKAEVKVAEFISEYMYACHTDAPYTR